MKEMKRLFGAEAVAAEGKLMNETRRNVRKYEGIIAKGPPRIPRQNGSTKIVLFQGELMGRG